MHMSFQLLCLALLATLLAPHPAMAAARDPLACTKVESHEFKAERTVISGSCPKIDLSHRQILGSLEFRDLTGLSQLDLSGSRIEGSLSIIGVALETLLLRGTQVRGDVNIAERSGPYEWIDNQAQETCTCQREYGRIQFEEVNASSLSARSFTMNAVGAEKFFMDSARVDGPVTLSRAWFGEIVSFSNLHALELALNSTVFTGELLAAQAELGDGLTLECSEVGEKLSFWGARFGNLQLEGTRFNGTKHVWGFRSEMQQLTLGAAEGSIQMFRLERSFIRVLRLTDNRNCLRGPTINRLRTAGMTFEWMEGDVDEPYANYFFAKGQNDDPILYGRLADAYSARGQHDEADKALRYQRPLLGGIRTLASSPFGLALLVALWLTPVALWRCRDWPKGAGPIDRAVLALDLLLPDLVALSARERYEKELKDLSEWRALLLAAYRLSGWLIISAIIYVLVERASY